MDSKSELEEILATIDSPQTGNLKRYIAVAILFTAISLYYLLSTPAPVPTSPLHHFPLSVELPIRSLLPKSGFATLYLKKKLLISKVYLTIPLEREASPTAKVTISLSREALKQLLSHLQQIDRIVALPFTNFEQEAYEINF